MKKILLALIFIFSLYQYRHGQWITSGAGIYYKGIGIIAPPARRADQGRKSSGKPIKRITGLGTNSTNESGKDYYLISQHN